MKNIIKYSIFLLSLTSLWGCKKDNYPGARISPFIAIYDLKNLYKGQDVALTVETMFGSGNITGVVVSDHSGGNLPEGLLAVQDRRRLNELRGISLQIGAKAEEFSPGDSVVINIEGGILKRVDGILQITNVPESAVTKASSGNTIPVNRVPSNLILANPDKYESTLAIIVKGGFDPLPGPADVLAGDKSLNDGFANIILRTAPTAGFANNAAPFLANFYGIAFNTIGSEGELIPRFHLRTGNDVVVLSSTVEVTPVIITGFMSDVKGGDGNYEYVQLMATEDIDFSTRPFSLVVTNNANASTPTGYPANGWATGGKRTFKFNLTSGTASKGSFFYVGGTEKMINGSGSTSMSTSNWIRSFNYTTTGGDDFGEKTGGLFANSGNASGIAVFEGINLSAASKPVDVLFIGSSGSLFTPGPPAIGYRITNTDLYDVKNPITLEDQPFYRAGTNTIFFPYSTADQGYFNMLGGEYNRTLGRWMKARNQTTVLLTKQSAITEIEGEGATVLK